MKTIASEEQRASQKGLELQPVTCASSPARFGPLAQLRQLQKTDGRVRRRMA